MKTKFVLALVLASMVMLIGGLAGCNAGSTSTLDESAVRAYADPAAETTLQGLSEGDLEKYTQYGDAQFKQAVTQEILDPVTAQVGSQLGSFVSITYLSMEESGEYIVVHYKANYTKGEVGVRMVFDADGLVAGQFFE